MSGLGFERHPLYYKIVGYSIYAVAGFLLVVNARCTAIAYRDGDVPLLVGWLFGLSFTAVSIGTGIFLTSPQTWGPLWFSFCATAATAGRMGDRSAPRALMAPLLAVLVAGILGFWGIINFLDWHSTWDYFARLGVQGVYLLSTVAILIIGPEFCFVVAHAVLKHAQLARMSQLETAIATDPQEIYMNEIYKGRVNMARMAGQHDAQQMQR